MNPRQDLNTNTTNPNVQLPDLALEAGVHLAATAVFKTVGGFASALLTTQSCGETDRYPEHIEQLMKLQQPANRTEIPFNLSLNRSDLFGQHQQPSSKPQELMSSTSVQQTEIPFNLSVNRHHLFAKNQQVNIKPQELFSSNSVKQHEIPFNLSLNRLHLPEHSQLCSVNALDPISSSSENRFNPFPGTGFNPDQGKGPQPLPFTPPIGFNPDQGKRPQPLPFTPPISFYPDQEKQPQPLPFMPSMGGDAFRSGKEKERQLLPYSTSNNNLLFAANQNQSSLNHMIQPDGLLPKSYSPNSHEIKSSFTFKKY